MAEISPIEFGEMKANVANLQRDVSSLQSDLADVRKDLKELLELANKSKGGLWAGMAIVSSLSACIGFVINHFTKV